MGRRIAQARRRGGLTQAELAAAIDVDRSALSKIESGDRRVSALELGRLAHALGERIEWFVSDGPTTVVSRRNALAGVPSPEIDRLAERVTRSVEFVIEHDARLALPAADPEPMPGTAAEAERLAAHARALLAQPSGGPLPRLAECAASRGLLVFAVDLGAEGADAATVLLRTGGIAIVNGGRQVGRRRLALAHELGHYLVADEYTVDWRIGEGQDAAAREGLFDRFARALLLPAESLRADWSAYSRGNAGDVRTAAVRIASTYRVDMATLATRLIELRVLGHAEASRIRSVRTTRADIVELGLVVADELEPPALPREYELAVLRLFRGETVSTARALDLLLDTWTTDMLPDLPERSEDEVWRYV